MHDPKRILIVRLSHLGDVVCALPLFHALRDAYPHAELAWAVQPEFAELLEGLPGLSRVFAFERRGGVRAWPKLQAALRRFRPDWCIDVQGNAKSALVSLISGAPRRFGPHVSEWREPFAAHVLTDRLPPPVPGASRHVVARTLRLAEHLGGASAPRFDPLLSLAEEQHGEALLGVLLGERSTAGEELESESDAALFDAPVDLLADSEAPAPPERGAPLTILHPNAPGDVRALPETTWVALARQLRDRGHDVLILTGPGERDLGERLASALAHDPHVRHGIGQRGVRALAGIFDAAAKRDARLVACDSAPSHLAAACGLSVVLVAGPTDARTTGPFEYPDASPHRVVRAREEPDCAPCRSRRCRHPNGPVCMSGIRTADIVTAVTS